MPKTGFLEGPSESDVHEVRRTPDSGVKNPRGTSEAAYADNAQRDMSEQSWGDGSNGPWQVFQGKQIRMMKFQFSSYKWSSSIL
ncbi:hypothetical protein AV530_012494 [Patagioenas fasciata monilis]|uniref:Uncharacterized protein n=1 Tax=Patagioenas fasciata monilis TaxID=372326 RepID=A0A1V4JBG7_PATFA|nr:hypothetical protein AV530_012494 [Patagioenas fasciata monilis]